MQSHIEGISKVFREGYILLLLLIRSLMTSLSSNSGRLDVIRPNTTFLLGETSRNGSKPSQSDHHQILGNKRLHFPWQIG